jgi:hypothetical protein
MNANRETTIKRCLRTLRDSARAAGERALAATTLAAACNAGDGEAALAVPVAPLFDTPESRMFGYGIRHENALVWDGKSTRTGTITYVDAERIEQYVGQQHWVAYGQSELGEPGFVLGDQVRIGRRAGTLTIEATANNRLATVVQNSDPAVRSGLTVLRTQELGAQEIASAVGAIAERCAATFTDGTDCSLLTFPLGAQLLISTCDSAGLPDLTGLVSEPVAGALRLEVLVGSNLPDAALEAERALTFGAAFIASAGEAVAFDDTGAVLGAQELYDLALRDEPRAAAFSVAAAAAQRTWPAQTMWLSDRGGVCDELTVVSRRAWRADFAAAFINRALDAFSNTRHLTGDPIIPAQGRLYSDDERAEPGALQRLAVLSYPKVVFEVSFLDLTAGNAKRLAAAREDVAALLGGVPQSAIVIAFGNSANDSKSDEFVLDMRRADVLATAIAASLVRRGDAIGVDPSGALYGADELIQLTLARCGKDVSWTARVAALRSQGP